MSLRIRISRLPLFEVCGVLALLLIGWAAIQLYESAPDANRRQLELADSWKQRSQALDQLSNHCFTVEGFLQTNLTELERDLTKFWDTNNPVVVEKSKRQIAEWKRWLGATNRWWEALSTDLPASPSPAPVRGGAATNKLAWALRELSALRERTTTASTDYLKAAEYLVNNPGRKPLIQPKKDAAQEDLQRAKSELLALVQATHLYGEIVGAEAEECHRQSLDVRTHLRRLRLALVLAALGFSFVLLALLYRRRAAQTRAALRAQEHQHREQLARLEKLAHFSGLAQELAHEIKQPLTAISARLYTLQKTLASGTDAHKDAAVIRTEISRLDQTVKDFLIMARPPEPRPIWLTAEQAFGEVRDLMAAQFANAAVEFKYEVEGDVRIRADPQLLKQVLINLLKNAAESIVGRGTITLRARKATRELNSPAADVVLVEVQDTGQGIPTEIQEKIFDPFFSTKEAGSGLGLVISARIVDKHGGKLEFESRPGEGTTFRIVLPAGGGETTV